MYINTFLSIYVHPNIINFSPLLQLGGQKYNPTPTNNPLFHTQHTQSPRFNGDPFSECQEKKKLRGRVGIYFQNNETGCQKDLYTSCGLYYRQNY